MPLMNVLVTLIVVGVLLWLVNSYIPMDAKIKQILNIVAVIAVVLLWAFATSRLRMLAVASVWSGAVGSALFALNGPGSGTIERFAFSAEVWLVIRLASAVAALWAAYLGSQILLAWWRMGNKVEED